VPVADGGEGTTEAIVDATDGSLRAAVVADPLGRPVQACWGLCGDGVTAVVEMARASGLELLAPDERDPTRTSTWGTGELIRCALDGGAESLIVGIGGSATVDGGSGMAAALGVRFLDADGDVIERPCGGRLADVAAIDATGADERLRNVEVVVASDVTNPLLGEEGAARVYGPQKGAGPEQVVQLEAGLANLADVIRSDLGREVAELPGAGAAGGLGAGLVAFLDAELRSGAETVMEAVGLRGRMAGSDLVITAEGRVDGHSAFGKATGCVAKAAHEAGIPAVVLAGSLGPGFERLYEQGVCAVLPIVDGPVALPAALERAEGCLERAAESLVRVWNAAKGGRDA
jgi:glycerate kinase